jgi:hypothetical protein
MNVRIENIQNPFSGRDTNSKFIIIETNGITQKVLVGLTQREARGYGYDCHSVSTPNKALHEATLVITTDYLLRRFNVVKNRYGSNDICGMNSKEFLNTELPRLIKSMGYINPYYTSSIETTIIQAISMITDEPIYLVGGQYKTHRDLHSGIIKFRSLTHSFVH